MLPTAHIVDQQDDAVTLRFVVASGDAVFDGHFPGHPVLPGVVQIDWAVRLGERHLGTSAHMGRDLRMKFRRVVAPDTVLTLHLRIDRAKNRLSFSYCAGDGETASGMIGLAV